MNRTEIHNSYGKFAEGRKVYHMGRWWVFYWGWHEVRVRSYAAYVSPRPQGSVRRVSARGQGTDHRGFESNGFGSRCIHPGVFAKSPDAYKDVAIPTEHCYTCGRDIHIKFL